MLYDQAFTTAKAGSNGHLTLGLDDPSFQITCLPFGCQRMQMYALRIGLTSAPEQHPCSRLARLRYLYDHNGLVAQSQCSPCSIAPSTSD